MQHLVDPDGGPGGEPTAPSELPGLDRRSVSRWLAGSAGLHAPFQFELISGGRSNLTFAVTDSDGRRAVLRRPPTGQVLESAHDMGREHRIISALAGTGFPVPRPLAFCADPAVNGAPFYLMELLDGRIVRDAAAAERLLAPAQRRTVSNSVIEVLAELHALDPDRSALGDLGRREDYVGRQLRRWHRQWQAAKTREIPVVERVHALLEASVPAQQRVAIVHGDYRLDNLVLAPAGSIDAVLDWELCTLGDPLADVGMLLVNWLAPGEDDRHMLIGAPTAAGGFASRAELVDRYAAATGADLSRIGFYKALALWKLACIAEGMYARYRSGAMGEGSREAAGRVGEQVALLAQRALQALGTDQH